MWLNNLSPNPIEYELYFQRVEYEKVASEK